MFEKQNETESENIQKNGKKNSTSKQILYKTVDSTRNFMLTKS